MRNKIAIIGKSGSGKDYLAKHIIERYKGKRFAFADYVKRNIQNILGLNETEFEKFLHDEDFKNYSLVHLPTMRLVVVSDIEQKSPYWKLNNLCSAKKLEDNIELSFKTYEKLDDLNVYMTLREFTVYYGTNVAQKFLGRKVWCNALFNSEEYDDATDTDQFIIITDVRFPHEYEECQKRGFAFVGVHSNTENKLDNIAESYFDTFQEDYLFYNDKTNPWKFADEYEDLCDWIENG